jgi:hypothetical protein
VPACLRAFQLPPTFDDRGASVLKADEKPANPKTNFGDVARKGYPHHRP